MSRIKNCARFRDRGIAAVEMALIMPLLATLLLGGVDIARYVLLQGKAERVAFSVADIVAQSESVTADDLEDVLGGASEIMQPFNLSEEGRVIVSSVYRDADGTPQKTRWRYEGGGALARTSQVGAVDGAAALPGALALNERENVVVTEVFYRFEPIFPGAELFVSSDIYKTAVFKPRLGALITPPS